VTRIPQPPLVYLITDGTLTSNNYDNKVSSHAALIKAAVSARIPLIQIREKQLPAAMLYELSALSARCTSGSDTRLLINDRLDVALAAGADGVHLTTDSVRPDVIRRCCADSFVIAVSTHSVAEIRSAQDQGADLAVFGPVFRTSGKGPVVGLDGLRAAVESAAGFPVLALGGVNGSNYRDVLDCGAAGFAAIRYLNDVSALRKLSQELGLQT
jgi:thiamine-phosphate pyrophosphorylase